MNNPPTRLEVKQMSNEHFTPDGSDSTIDAPICFGSHLSVSQVRNLETTTIRQIAQAAIEPTSVPKAEAAWFIPSTLRNRKADKQLDEGQYVGTALDFDQVDDYQALLDGLERVLGRMVYVAYTTKSATKENQRMRVVIPFNRAISGNEYKTVAAAMYDDLHANGLKVDECVKKVAQISFMPNVGKTYAAIIHNGHERLQARPTLGGAALDFDDAMLFDPLELYATKIDAASSEQADIDRELEKAVAKQRRKLSKSRKQPELDSPIDWFNQVTPIEELLIDQGYERKENKYRHPASKSGSFSGIVFGNSPGAARYFTLSTDDKLYAEDQARDAFDVFTTLHFGGNRDAAIKDVAAQMRSIKSPAGQQGVSSWESLPVVEPKKSLEIACRSMPTIDYEITPFRGAMS